MITSGVESRVLYIGTSADVKPLGNIEFAAKFYESDTGVTFIWTGTNAAGGPGANAITGNWVEYLPIWPAPFSLTGAPGLR